MLIHTAVSISIWKPGLDPQPKWPLVTRLVERTPLLVAPSESLFRKISQNFFSGGCCHVALYGAGDADRRQFRRFR